MIEHRGCFTENEIRLIELLDKCMSELFFAEGFVAKTGEDVRYEVNIGNSYTRVPFELQFCVRDHENLTSESNNFVQISSIQVPLEYRRRGVATRIIFLMSHVATREIGVDLYVTGTSNDLWKERLLSAGSIINSDGDIQIFYEPFMEHFNSKLMVPNYLT